MTLAETLALHSGWIAGVIGATVAGGFALAGPLFLFSRTRR
ncbi:MAG TPA: hypothetical protein QGF58_12240 [Myxococcota bacterium]|nr:hypothetical protein [Myxococcota bacterium]